MKTRFIFRLLSLFLFLGFSVHAQYTPLLANNNKWNIKNCYISWNNIDEYTPIACNSSSVAEDFMYETDINDTTYINDTMYYNLKRISYDFWGNFTDTFLQGYLMEDTIARKIYYKPVDYPNELFCILNFSVNVGDTLDYCYPIGSSCSKKNYPVYVLSIDTINLINSKTKRIKPNNRTLQQIEGVGTISGLFMHYNSEIGTPLLTRFYKNGQLEYELDVLVSKTDDIIICPPKVYPNPSTELFFIETDRLQNIFIEDITGRVLFNESAFEYDSVANRYVFKNHNLPAGIYFLRVQNNQTFYSYKIQILP